MAPDKAQERKMRDRLGEMLHQQIVCIELNALIPFLELVATVADDEITRIEATMPDWHSIAPDEQADLVWTPLTWEMVAARSVYYEIAATVEHEVQRLAHPIWSEKQRARGQSIESDLRDWLSHQISDEKFGKLAKLICDRYGTDIRGLPGAATVERVRDVVNDFKHRKGVIDTRRQRDSHGPFWMKHNIGVEDALASLRDTKEFLGALWGLDNRGDDVSAQEG